VANLQITLRKSPIGYSQDQRGTLRALGLKKLNQTVERDDSASVRGMVEKVKHLVTVVEKR
jgi:large subunit ribosomal protein L30